MVKGLQQKYEERFWRGRKKPFGIAFQETQHLRKEINNEIGYLLARKTVYGRVSQFGGKRRLINALVRDLRDMNDERNEISVYERKKLKRILKETGQGKRAPVKIYWFDLNEEQFELIVERIRHEQKRLSPQELLYANDISEGLTETPVKDDIEQQEYVLDNLKKLYNERKDEEVTYGGWTDEGEIKYRGYRTRSGKDTGYEKREPLTISAIKALKHRKEEREMIAERGSVVYGTVFFLALLFGAFLYIVFTRAVENKFIIEPKREDDKAVKTV